MSSDDEDLFAPAGDARPHDPVKFEHQLKLERSALYERVGLDLGLVTVTASSPKAIQVSFSTLRLPSSWVPLSQVHAGSEVPRASWGVLVVTKWMAVKLEAYESIPGSGRLFLVAEHRKPLSYDRFPETE